jgi:hypothetical protein
MVPGRLPDASGVGTDGSQLHSVAPPLPMMVLHALRESAQRMREQAQQKVGV